MSSITVLRGRFSFTLFVSLLLCLYPSIESSLVSVLCFELSENASCELVSYLCVLRVGLRISEANRGRCKAFSRFT